MEFCMAVITSHWLGASALWLLMFLIQFLKGGHLHHEWQLISELANRFQTWHGKKYCCIRNCIPKKIILNTLFRNILWWVQHPSYPIHISWININLIFKIFAYWINLKDVRFCYIMHATSKTWRKVSVLRSLRLIIRTKENKKMKSINRAGKRVQVF